MRALPRINFQTCFNLLRFICRTTWRDWVAKELFLLFVAIVLAVSALSSVALLADRFKQGIELESNQLIAADMRLRSDRPIDLAFADRALAEGLVIAETVNFPSMVSLAANSSGVSPSRLAAIKAVGQNYPLRGKITLASANLDAQTNFRHPLKKQLALKTVWVDAALLQSLNAKVGDKIKLGSAELTVADVIQREPDRGLAWINFSPRVMMRVEDLAATQLLGIGSRATYRLLVAGSKPNLSNYQAWVNAVSRQINNERNEPIQRDQPLNTSAPGPEQNLSSSLRSVKLNQNLKQPEHLAISEALRQAAQNIRVETVADNQAQFEEIFVRSKRFLSLAALLTAVMSAVAIGLSSQRFAKRHTQSAALLRCLGIGKQTLKCLYIGEYIVLGTLAGLIGIGLGAVSQHFLLHSVQAYLATPLPLPTIWPAVQAWLAGITLLFAFGLPPLLMVAQTPPITVLRHTESPIDRLFFKLYIPGIFVFAVILLWVAGDWKLGVAVMLSCLAGLLWFVLFGHLFLSLLKKGSSKLSSSLNSSAFFFIRYALQTMERRRRLTLTQITSLATALLSLFLLSATSHDLLKGWQQSMPKDFPNRFLVDIQPDQAARISQALNAKPFFESNSEPVKLSPIIRARLISHNQRPIDVNQYVDTRTRQMVTREFNLSYREDLPTDNRIVAGKWFEPGSRSTHHELSVTENIAEQLKIKLGDQLKFEIAGMPIEFQVTSLRVVDWTTFRPNFFMLATPNALKNVPANYLASFFLTEKGQVALDRLIKKFPNLTVIDITAILNQLQNIILQITKVIEILFLFTLSASILVLVTAFAHSHEARMYEVSLLRTLGASLKQIFLIQWVELSIVGLIAGILAALSAQTGVWFLARFIFKFDLTVNFWLLLGGPVVGWLSAIMAGLPMCRRILKNPPLAFLYR